MWSRPVSIHFWPSTSLADGLEALVDERDGKDVVIVLVRQRVGAQAALLPVVTVSPDPFDNYLLATAAAGSADFLVTGDKGDLLALKLYEGTKIITVRDFLV
jgi:predicted nucleic acid-binding protein